MGFSVAFTHVNDAIAWLESQVSHGIKPGLKRMEWMMEELGHPHRNLKWIHVAGTNGKGSTCAFIESVLRRGGFDTGMFTSPYITSFQQRISYNGEPIADVDLLRLINQVYALSDQLNQTDLGAPTMFELVTVVSILYFATIAYPDYVVWETGLGGRLDSTNIVVPVISVITSIAMDHTEFLGDTIEAIAAEKAGIIKAGVPVVTGVQDSEALNVIRRIAKEKNATLYEAGKHFQTIEIASGGPAHGDTFQFEGIFSTYTPVVSGLIGSYQKINASIALMTIDVLRQYLALVVDSEEVIKAITDVQWPGRMEWINKEQTLLVDGAHNPQGAQALAQTLFQWPEDRKPFIFLIAVMGTKDVRGILPSWLPLASEMIVTTLPVRGGMNAELLNDAMIKERERMGFDGQVSVRMIADWKEAISQWKLAVADSGGTGIACGSLYWIADVRRWVKDGLESSKGW